MTKDEAENGPLYQFISDVYSDGFVEFVCLKNGKTDLGAPEFIRLANADAKYGERSRCAGDYGP